MIFRSFKHQTSKCYPRVIVWQRILDSANRAWEKNTHWRFN